MINKSEVKKILVISLSNIGDVILTFPVMDILKAEFPQAKLSVVIGPKAETLLMANPLLDKVYLYDKRQKIWKILEWIWKLRRENFDLVVDLRNTAIPLLLGARYRTSVFAASAEHGHMKDKHILRLKTLLPGAQPTKMRFALYLSDESKDYIQKVIKSYMNQLSKYIVICPGAADSNKRWGAQGFKKLADCLIEIFDTRIFFAGDESDWNFVNQLMQHMKHAGVNLCGMTTLSQLASLIEGACLVITNDSAPLHLASYLNKPVVALFGPTDPRLFGPWSEKSHSIRRNENCPACQHLKGFPHNCMKNITWEEVFELIQTEFREVLAYP